MDMSRDMMIERIKGSGSQPMLLNNKYMDNLQNPKKAIVSIPKKVDMQAKVDKIVGSKAWKLKEQFVELTKKRKSFLFNFVVFSIFLVTLTSFLIYQRNQKKNSIQGIMEKENKKDLNYSKV